MAKPLPEAVDKAVTEMFVKMDTDGDGNINLQEAQTFWGKNFSKINATALFNEVDTDKSKEISLEEWKDFWQNVLAHGYPEDDVLEEIDSMMQGGSWVDWNDDRTT